MRSVARLLSQVLAQIEAQSTQSRQRMHSSNKELEAALQLLGVTPTASLAQMKKPIEGKSAYTIQINC